MKFYRRGAIRFIKLGRFGFSWWWSKRKPCTDAMAGRFWQGYSVYGGRDVA